MTPGVDTPRDDWGGPWGADEVTCQQFVELITNYLEGELPPGIVSLIEEHLVMCDWCVDYAEQMRTTIAQLASLRGAEAEMAGPSEAVLAVLRAGRGGA